jgi:hypothetical protein
VCRTDIYGCYIWNTVTSRWEQLRTIKRMPSQDAAPGNSATEAGGWKIQVAPSDSNCIYMVTGFFIGSALNSYVYVSRRRGRSFQRRPGWTLETEELNGNDFADIKDARRRIKQLHRGGPQGRAASGARIPITP